MISFWSYDWEYWYLYHKVTFDAVNKLILVNRDVTELDWKEDVYSAWKEWVQLETHTENPAVLPAMRSVGGDDITADGSRKVGSTYFLINGWRLKPWDGDYRLSILGNVYTEEGEPIYIPIDGDYKIVIEQTLSSLVELIAPDNTTTPLVPTLDEIADAVWNRQTSQNTTIGSIGSQLNTMNSSIYQSSTNLDDIISKLNTATDLIQTLLKYETNRTRIDRVQKKMLIYDNDGITVLHSFDLKDFDGIPSVTQIAERSPSL